MNATKTQLLSRITIIVFFAFLMIPNIIWSFIKDDIDISNTENRKFNAKPVFNLTELSKYPTLFELYFNDHLPFRKQFVTLNAYINLKLFKDLNSDRVLYGKNDWLFYKDTSDGDPLACYQGTNLLNKDELVLYQNKLLQTRELLQKNNIEFILMIAPNKEQVYSEYMPNHIRVLSDFSRADQLVSHLLEKTNLKIVYPLEELLKNKKHYQLYYKNDTHWNQLGSFIGAQQLLQAVISSRKSIVLEKLNIKVSNGEVIGDLALMENLQNILPKDKIFEVQNYLPNIQVNNIFLENNRNQAFFSTSQTHTSICVIHDSFATGMIPYIQKVVNRSFFYNFTSVTSQDILTAKPDVIIIEVVERYIPSILSICDNIIQSYDIKE